MVAVGVLGEVTAWAGGRAVDLGTARQRCILAVLAVQLNRVVPFERIARHTGDQSAALAHHQRALTLFRELGNSHLEATTLDHLGSVHDALGHRHRARAAWRQALELYLAQHRAEEARAVQLLLDSTPSSSCSSNGFR